MSFVTFIGSQCHLILSHLSCLWESRSFNAGSFVMFVEYTGHLMLGHLPCLWESGPFNAGSFTKVCGTHRSLNAVTFVMSV